MKHLSIALLLSVMACGVRAPDRPSDSPEVSEEDHIEGILATCADLADCAAPFVDSSLVQTTCEDTILGQLPEGCTFDPTAAELCLDALQSQTCDPATGSLSGDTTPCVEVYIDAQGASCSGQPRYSESAYLAGRLALCADAADCASILPGVEAADVCVACEDAI